MTRWGVIADVHANLPALDAVLTSLNALCVERIVSAGDVVGYGPHPNECVNRLREAGVQHVLGNHDMYVLGRLHGEGFVAAARHSLEWTRSELTDVSLDYLGQQPTLLPVDDIVVAHAALDHLEEYILVRRQATRQFTLLRSEWPAATVLLLGHTHQPTAFLDASGQARRLRVRAGQALPLRPDARYLLNPGSVGQSRQFEARPKSRFALLDTSRLTVTWHAIDYDDSTTRRDLADAGLPTDWVHAKPTLVRALIRRTRWFVR